MLRGLFLPLFKKNPGSVSLLHIPGLFLRHRGVPVEDLDFAVHLDQDVRKTLLEDILRAGEGPNVAALLNGFAICVGAYTAILRKVLGSLGNPGRTRSKFLEQVAFVRGLFYDSAIAPSLATEWAVIPRKARGWVRGVKLRVEISNARRVAILRNNHALVAEVVFAPEFRNLVERHVTAVAVLVTVAAVLAAVAAIRSEVASLNRKRIIQETKVNLYLPLI